MDPMTIASLVGTGAGLLGSLFGGGGGGGGSRYEPFLLEGSSINGPFGTVNSQLDTENNVLNTYAFLNQPLNDARLYAQAGLGETLQGLRNNYGSNFFLRSPQEQVAYLDSASNPIRALLDEQTARSINESIGRARVNAATTGNTNSTAYGTALGQIAHDKALRDAQNRVTGIDYEQNRMLSSLGGASQLLNNYQSTLQGLNALISPSMAATNSNVMQGLGLYAGMANNSNSLAGAAQRQSGLLNQSSLGSALAGGLTALGGLGNNNNNNNNSSGGFLGLGSSLARPTSSGYGSPITGGLFGSSPDWFNGVRNAMYSGARVQ